jgi:hypothetical protein
MTEFPDDVLRARLSRLDPAGPTVPVDPATSPRAAELMEHAMQSTEIPPAMTSLSAARRRRRPLLLVAAATAAAAAAVVGFVVVGADGGPGGRGSEASPGPTTLTLSLPASDAAASCVVFDVEYLREMPLAFAGTATDVGSDRVTLDVDHWYKGGTADRVTLARYEHSSVALDAVEFHAGERYLVTATGGTVNECGFSGPATPQLEAAFTEAFGG